MNILRLSTLSLTLAIAVFALGYNPSFADPKDCDGQHCNHGDAPGFPTDITVQLSGGAFVSVDNTLGVTAESEFKLSGDDPIHMIRPGGTAAVLCATGDAATNTLCLAWNSVFDLCLLLGPTGAEVVPEFTVPAGQKPWTIEKVVDEVWVNLVFPLDSPLDPSDPLFTSKPLSVALNLIGACLPGDCSLIPGSGSDLTIHLTDYSIHLRARGGGVSHQAECHAGSGVIGEKVGPRTPTNLVITRPAIPQP